MPDWHRDSAGVPGSDRRAVIEAFRQQGFAGYTRDERYRYVELPVSQIPSLRDLPLEVGISSAVIENREGESDIRELKLDLTTPQQFDLAADL